MTNAGVSLRWLARDEPDIGKVAQLTTRIATSARRADDIVRRIRSMAVKQAPEPVPIALNDLVQESLLFVRHEIETRGIRVTTSYARRVPKIVGDRTQLQQVIVNLLINAAQPVDAECEADREINLAKRAGLNGHTLFTFRDQVP